MALDILITSTRIENDPVARRYIDFLQNDQLNIGLSSATLYYDFPTYSDYETVSHKPDILIVSPLHGVIVAHFIPAEQSVNVQEIDSSVLQFSSIMIGRLLKSRMLRRSLSALKFGVSPLLIFPSQFGDYGDPVVESMAVESLDGLTALLRELEGERVTESELAEIRSVLEGAKALSRPKPRPVTTSGPPQTLAVALNKLDSEIANFDERQRRAALVNFTGPQRIRGLAGSGKTVILAMKAAHLHLTDPSAHILVTFYTRSLQASLKQLITRFYRNYRDEDPDWDMVHIRHGWGGSSRPGTYSDACRRHGVVPLTFPTANQGAFDDFQRNPGKPRMEAFEFACAALLKNSKISSYYDHILIDEGQDFRPSFYQLCFMLAKGERDRKSIVWAYDELQNILDVKMRSPEMLFGTDSDGQPRILLQRAAKHLPPGSDNDTVLEKCYRNQREILVTAHTLGFGIYGPHIVQLLESPEHWEDVGYRVSGSEPFKVGQKVEILRPEENSPTSIDNSTGRPLICQRTFTAFTDEIDWVCDEIVAFIQGGLQPEDIIIISLDDRNAKNYFRGISSKLAALGLATNNIIADPYNEPPFLIPGRITLSTVYRAKGNEAAVVCVVGVEAISLVSRLSRNKLFVAFTRTKAWLRVSGIGDVADAIGAEIDAAAKNFPYIRFQMPDLNRVETIQRDLNQRTIRVKRLRAAYLEKLRAEGLEESDVAAIIGIDTKDE